MKKRNKHLLVKTTQLCLALMLGGLATAHAAQSSLSTPVVGHMPVASAVKLTPAAPMAGQTVSVSWAYADADGDVQSASTVEWLLNGVVMAGQVGTSYTLPPDSASRTLQARVTPVSAAPASPAVGVAASSASVTIATNPTGSFTKPFPKMMWSEADAYCKGLTPAARLPTAAEMQALFIDATSATKIGDTNFDMCDLYGWPLSGMCGGETHQYTGFYWTSTRENSYHHRYVNMTTGSASAYSSGEETLKNHFVCVR